jgi:hypothetical protein
MINRNQFPLIGIGCVALTGKDTFYKLFSSILKDYGISCERVALADNLKSEVDRFCKEKYGISAFTKDPKEKEIIRDCFVSHGKIMRKLSHGKYWTSLVQPIVDNYKNEGKLVICTDIRFAEFECDEINWLKEKNKGIYIHINRFGANGEKFLPINQEEEKNEKILKNKADFTLNWTTSDDQDYLKDTIILQLKDLIFNICPNYQIMN